MKKNCFRESKKEDIFLKKIYKGILFVKNTDFIILAYINQSGSL